MRKTPNKIRGGGVIFGIKLNLVIVVKGKIGQTNLKSDNGSDVIFYVCII